MSRRSRSRAVYGIELCGHLTPQNYQTHRILCHAKSVTISTRTATSPPTTTAKTFRTHRAALDFAGAQADHFHLISDCIITHEADLELDSDTTITPDQAFERDWERRVRLSLGAELPTPRRYWALFANLDRAATYNHGAAATRGYLQGAPHATDDTRYQTVGLVGQLPGVPDNLTHTALNGNALDVGVYLLGDRSPACIHGSPACTPCETRTAELLEFLCRAQDIRSLDWEQRMHLVRCSRRLAAAGHHPVPDLATA